MSLAINLSVREFESADLPTVSDWWAAHHEGDFPANLLPPVGVVAMDEAGPVFACWLYMAAGVGICWLEYPVSRPGISLEQARSAFRITLAALEEIGRRHDYGVMIAHTLPPIARLLKAFGFHAEHREKITTLKVICHGS